MTKSFVSDTARRAIKPAFQRSLALLLLAAAGGCAKARPSDEPFGVPMNPTATPLIAAEEGDGPAARLLLPLEIGNTWTYRVGGASGACTEGEHTRSITRQAQVGGRSAFISSGFCGKDDEVAFASEGSQVLQFDDGEWRTALASTLVDEQTWDYTSEVAYHWHRVGWVRVPAGLFANCWERLPTDNSWSQIYCDGAGMVSMSGDDLLVELTSFNLNHGALVSQADTSG